MVKEAAMAEAVVGMMAATAAAKMAAVMPIMAAVVTVLLQRCWQQ